jgi:dienelactone hydrolase
MAEVLLFHHALGLTPGVVSFADGLRAEGHVVHTPDLYEGKTFDSVDDGVANAREVGFGTILERGRAAAEDLPNELVYGGFSLGVMPAQMLAQTRAGAQGALFFYAALPPSATTTSTAPRCSASGWSPSSRSKRPRRAALQGGPARTSAQQDGTSLSLVTQPCAATSLWW